MTNNTQLPAEAKWKLEETEGDDVLLTNGKITMATSNVEDEYLRAILVLLNNCGGDFHSENELETKLGVELHIASYELEQYKAKCDQYEKALKDIMNRSRPQDMIYIIANEALSGEGDKAAPGVSIMEHIHYCHDCGFPVDECNCDEDELNQKEDKQ